MRAPTVVAWPSLPSRSLMRGDLHLEIGRGDVQVAVLLLEQHIGEDRQRVPAFDDAGNRLQRFQAAHPARSVLVALVYNTRND